MKHLGFALAVALAAVTFVVSDYADAARLGGGRSLGTQRQSIAPQHATPPASSQNPNAASQPVMPAQPGAVPAKPGTPAAAPAASGMSRWLGPIAGIAAGLGIAALLSHFGLPEGLGSFLLLALVAGRRHLPGADVPRSPHAAGAGADAIRGHRPCRQHAGQPRNGGAGLGRIKGRSR